MKLEEFGIGTGHDTFGRRIFTLGRPLEPLDPQRQAAKPPDDWMQAKPREIGKALERALALPSGGWFAVDASRRITDRPQSYWVDSREVVAWRAEGAIHMAPKRQVGQMMLDVLAGGDGLC